MCVTLSRQCAGGAVTPERAASFAGAAVISGLSMADWQISEDAEAAMSSAVESLPDFPDHLELVLHLDWIDVSAFLGPIVARRRCFPRVPFRTPIACTSAEIPADTVASRAPRLVTASSGPDRALR